jgi:hypothetical protein
LIVTTTRACQYRGWVPVVATSTAFKGPSMLQLFDELVAWFVHGTCSELRSTIIISHYDVRELRSTIIISTYRFRLSTLFKLKTGGWFLSDFTLCVTTGGVIRTRASATHPVLPGRRISSFSAPLPSSSASFAKSYHRSNNLIRRSYSGSSCCHLFFGHVRRSKLVRIGSRDQRKKRRFELGKAGEDGCI